MKEFIKLKNISKKYNNNYIFKDFNLSILENEFVLISGESGKGKTTLLNIISKLDKVNSGEVIVNGKIGYLFQNFALIENEDIYNNLKLVEKDKDKIIGALNKVNLDKHDLKTPIFTLSGGEQQRVAIARLILQNVDIVLCDEPTGSLDDKNSNLILEEIIKLHKSGKTILVVSHSNIFDDVATKKIEL
ncbi:MAG: ATP-binding cassette domain-containing protein [Mycoplasmatales bacterium]